MRYQKHVVRVYFEEMRCEMRHVQSKRGERQCMDEPVIGSQRQGIRISTTSAKYSWAVCYLCLSLKCIHTLHIYSVFLYLGFAVAVTSIVVFILTKQSPAR